MRKNWKGREKKEAAWFILDADKLLLEGNRSGAIELLNAHTFQGKDDSGRLIRLALLNVRENPRLAWEYLAEAYAKDPDNPEIRSYRARLLEVVGQTPLALIEYVGAAQGAPKQLFFQDQLAEFYRRHNRYDLAVAVWKNSLSSPESDFLWLKAWFWSRVVAPFDIDWKKIKPPTGKLQPFLEYLAALKPGTFWDSRAFEKLPDAQSYLQSQQAAFWLRLLDACQRHDESGAWELLQYNAFTPQSWNIDLEKLLKRVLTYRKIGSFSIEVGSDESESKPLGESKSKLPIPDVAQKVHEKSKPVHPLFTELNSLSMRGADVSKISPGLKQILTSDLAVPSCFLASGWLASSLDLTPQPITIPADFPEWVAYDYAEALKVVRGPQAVLDFIAKQPPTPPLSMLAGETLIQTGRTDEGEEKLRALSAEDSEVGMRSAWLLSLLYMDRKQYDQARAVIKGQSRLANDVLGKETEARIALLEGNNDLAEKLYGAIEKQSWEAKSFLARKAFGDKDYKRAKVLTEELLRQFPSNSVLLQNYKRILEEEKKGVTEVKEPPAEPKTVEKTGKTAETKKKP